MASRMWDVYVNVPKNDLSLYDRFDGIHLVSRGPETDRYWIDSVWFHGDMDWREVKASLVRHDGYPSNIWVQRRASHD